VTWGKDAEARSWRQHWHKHRVWEKQAQHQKPKVALSDGTTAASQLPSDAQAPAENRAMEMTCPDAPKRRELNTSSAPCGKAGVGDHGVCKVRERWSASPVPQPTEKPTDGGEQGQGCRTGLWSCSRVPRSS